MISARKRDRTSACTLIAVLLLFFFAGMASAQTTHVVTNLNDSGAGSLRQAIADVDVAGLDTITFAVTGTIDLNGSINVTKGVRIIGPGAKYLHINQTAGFSGHFVLNMPSAHLLRLQGLTLKNGTESSIHAITGTLDVIDCVITGNSSVKGGALRVESTITNDIFIEYCEISNNTAQEGSAIYSEMWLTGFLEVRNTTISGNNNTTGTGGAIYAATVNANIDLNQCTVTGNFHTAGSTALYINAGTSLLDNTVIANNPDTSTPDVTEANGGVITSSDYNIIGYDPSGFVGSIGTGDVVGNPTALNIVFSALADNGGQSKTHATSDSRLLDKIPAGANGSFSEDQRNYARDSNRDIGAWEASAAPSATGGVTVVTKVPTVSSSDPEVLFTGTITNLGPGISEKGFVWATTSDPDINDTVIINSDMVGEGNDYIHALTGLSFNTTYYVRAYAKRSGDNTVFYGANLSFTTPNVSEIRVFGKSSNEISDGDTTPSTTDGTSFGSVSVSSGFSDTTFTVRNDGSASLTYTVSITGTGNAHFSASGSTSGTLPTSNTSTFTVRFDPMALGTHNATVSIDTNDPDEDPFTYAITGTGIEAPTATTNAATSPTTSGATLNGTINANNQSTTVTFEYGTTVAYGTTVTADQSPVTGTSNTAVSKVIAGLTPNTTYHYRVVGSSGAGTTNGSDQTFTTSAAIPTVTTNAANSISSTGATLNGTVNANNASSTVTFEYGTTNSYGTTVTADQSPVTGNTNTAVSKAITGLTPNTTYHFRVVGTNSSGTSNGADQTFTTGGAPPTATTSAASALSSTGVALNGTINANNESTTVTFEYGTTIAYGTTVTADQSPVSGSTNTAVSKAITGLTPNTTYHYRVVGTNGSGTTNGADMTFTTLPTFTLTVQGAGDGSGTVVADKGSISYSWDGSSGSGSASDSYNQGTEVVLSAVAAVGSTFAGWSGGLTGSLNPDSVTLNVDTLVTATFTRDTGTLEVEITDPSGSGTYSISGPADFNGGNPLTGQSGNYSDTVPTGDYTVTFEDVTDYDIQTSSIPAPPPVSPAAVPVNVTVAQGATTQVIGTYVRQTGTLTVTFDDGGSGGSYDLTGPQDFTGQTGNFSQSVYTGDYLISPNTVTGFNYSLSNSNPGSGLHTAVVTNGGTTDIVLSFVRATGTLEIVLIDAPAGGGWSVDSAPGDYSGSTSGTADYSNTGAETGSYSVSGINVPGYSWSVAPSDTQNVTDSFTTTFTITYEALTGSLGVAIRPTELIPEGRWRIVGLDGLYDDGDIATGLPAGTYIVQFQPVDGWRTPDQVAVQVLPGEVTHTGGTYRPLDLELPAIRYFVSSPEKVAAGEASSLSWEVEDATSISIDGVATDLPAKGSRAVTPGAGTIYTLRAANAQGEVTALARVGIAGAPQVLWFNADMETVNRGGEVILTWGGDGATSAIISTNGAGAAATRNVAPNTGSSSFKPRADTTYTLTLENEAGSTTAEVDVAVTRAPVITLFSAVPLVVVPGQEVLFTWSISGNPADLSIDPLIDEPVEDAEGEATHLPEGTQSYRLSASNNAGSDSAEINVKMKRLAKAADLTAEITSIKEAPDVDPAAGAIRTDAGTPLIVTAVITNDGAGKAKKFTVGLYADGELVTSRFIKRLKSGQETTVIFRYVPLAEGRPELMVHADAAGVTADLDRDNNAAAQQIRVNSVEGVDLTVSGLQVSRPADAGKHDLLVRYAITNVGDTASGSFEHSLQVSGTGTLPRVLEPLETDLAGLEAGETVWIQRAITLPSDIGSLIRIEAIADLLDAESESNEKNNTWVETLKLKDIQ